MAPWDLNADGMGTWIHLITTATSSQRHWNGGERKGGYLHWDFGGKNRLERW